MSSALRRRSKGVLFLSLPVANIFVFVVESLPYKKLVVGNWGSRRDERDSLSLSYPTVLASVS